MLSFFRVLMIAMLSMSIVGCATAKIHGLDGAVLKKIEHGSIITIWPKGTKGVNPNIPEKVRPENKRFLNIHNPNLTLYLPKKPNGTAIVLCPGGGYTIVASGIEGKPVAEMLIKEGITVFVLKYRLPKTPDVNFKHPVPLSDALRAVQFVRFNSKEFNINPKKIGIMGFSAGGHLASSAGTMFADYSFGSDDVSKVSSRADFMCLVYPVISTKKGIAHGCIKSLVPKSSNKKALAKLSNELNVTKNTPPAFLVHAKDDKGVKHQNSMVMHEALKNNGVQSELKLYNEGGHGFGPGREGTDSMKWTKDFIAWLHKTKIISSTK